MSTQIVYFFFCKLWQFVSFKELVHFIYVIKFVSIELFIVFLCYPFNVHGICSDVPSFTSDINDLYALFFLACLEAYQYYWFYLNHIRFSWFSLLISLNYVIFKKYLLFIYLFLAVLGLCCCVHTSSICGERGLLFVAVCGILIVVASLVAEHGL